MIPLTSHQKVVKRDHETKITTSPTTGQFHVLCSCGFKGEWRELEKEAKEDRRIHLFWEVRMESDSNGTT